jgi:vacuolar iron transporter family protein
LLHNRKSSLIDVFAFHTLKHSKTNVALGADFKLRHYPLQAALASAASFAVGAALPLGVAALAPTQGAIAWLVSSSLLSLALLGVVAARAGGSALLPSVWRVTFWGVLAMAATAGVGRLFGAAV